MNWKNFYKGFMEFIISGSVTIRNTVESCCLADQWGYRIAEEVECVVNPQDLEEIVTAQWVADRAK